MILTVVDVATACVTAVVSLLLLLTLLSPYVNPSRTWLFPILGLVAPAVFLVAGVLLLYWVVRWRWLWASMLLVPVVISLFDVSLFVKIDFKKEYGEPTFKRGHIKVVTYNVRNFYGEDKQSSVDKIALLLREKAPDIVCLQEFNTGEPVRKKFDGLMTGYNSTHHYSSLVVYTKYPIIHSGTLFSHSRDTLEINSMWVDVLVGADTVRVFNNHLHSTSINSDDDDFITTRRFLSDTARDEKIRSIISRFHHNSELRAVQVDTISRHIAESPYLKIVCGDFNDTPMSYAYRKMSHKLSDTFREKGSGFIHTYRGFLNTLRIDYILCSREFETLSYEVEDKVEFSDHHPVIARIKIGKTN